MQKRVLIVDLVDLVKSEYLIAKIGVDKAENEPSKVSSSIPALAI